MPTLAHRGMAMACGALLFAAATAFAQVPTRISGTLTGSDAFETDVITFSCDGADPCVGNFALRAKFVECNNAITFADVITITGLSLAAPGPISGTARFANASFEVDGHNGVCTTSPPTGDVIFTFTGTWNGTTATVTFNTGNVDSPIFSGTLKVEGAPPFALKVTASIGTTATVRADITYRAQDVGSAGSVYVFAVAPITQVLPSLLKDAGPAMPPLAYAKTRDGKETTVACVLAQLNGAGQLQQVSASSLQAFVTGVLGSAGQSIAVVNGVATAQIGGATFYVGYGANPQSMISGGVNRNVVTVPAALECKPSPPQTGWWWNSTEGGRGYSIEVQGNHIFYAAYLYDAQGNAQWYVAAGNTSIDGSLFTGDLLKFAGGQTLGGAFRAPGAAQPSGAITLAFSEATKGTMVWPGGTVSIERFAFTPAGLNVQPRINQPEGGWWWNPQESGRGFFMEWQGDSVDIAGYMYDDVGNPVWYLSLFPTPDILNYTANWLLFGNGQTLTGPYKPAMPINSNVAPLSIQFTSSTTATMTLPNGRSTQLVRYRF
ncbi:hypothetical protein DSM104443_01207 [Usitatibacter rugosus]|uniref:Uncharacterized protein n=1 Tax=Usitatibacter rugosus TaxID=2732067 RepID=A0A6M4GUZ3_9PROT|nr:hypothetical protein [Usitatibacter rugosus]QJR10153.1 hypothetical protein DSM104443_01207 [Usitatibacter rugosus]